MLRRLAVLSLGLAVAISVVGCGVRRRSGSGSACELASECSAPLVCRLGHCRNECATSGDCPEGLSCVLDQLGLGSCQTEEERDCLLSSECPAPLTCVLRQCVNECVQDRDCLGGARCEIGPEGGACIDVATTSCVSDPECLALSPDLYCLAGRCRALCITDRDCRRGLVCDRARGCVSSGDAGSIDAGTPDAPALDGGGALLVELVHVGTVTSTPAGVNCTNADFGPTPVDCPPATFTGSVLLTAVPDGAFGYTAVRWTGDCSTITPPGSCTVSSGVGRVRACFHDGSFTDCPP